MFQEEMFSNGSFKGAQYIANGCFGTVYAHPKNEDWVIKYATEDGTLNYLEWCKFMQDSGMAMRGMPVIDVLTHIGMKRYMVTMRRYADSRSKLPEYANVSEACEDAGHGYIADLIEAFETYCHDHLMHPDTSQVRGMVGDLHRGNIMWCNETDSFIITDPSAAGYKQSRTPAFELH